MVERRKHDGTARYFAQYRDPEGRIRSAGTHSSRRAAERAGNREEQRVLVGNWHDHTLGAIPFQTYVEADWLPSKHIEATTRAAYVSNLTKHFLPFFGKKPMHQIEPLPHRDHRRRLLPDETSPSERRNPPQDQLINPEESGLLPGHQRGPETGR